MITSPLLIDIDSAPQIVRDVSTLPLSYRISRSADLVGVVVVDGSYGWADRALRTAESGCRGILVVDPVAERLDAIHRLRDQTRIPIVLAERWADDPAIAAAATAWSGQLDSARLFEVALTETERRGESAVILAMVRILRRLNVTDVGMTKLVTTRTTSLQLACTGNGGAVQLMRVVSSAGGDRLTIAASGATDRIHISLDSRSTARPGEVRRVHAHGAEVLPVPYESATRQALRRLRDIVELDEPTDELTAFADDLDTVAG